MDRADATQRAQKWWTTLSSGRALSPPPRDILTAATEVIAELADALDPNRASTFRLPRPQDVELLRSRGSALLAALGHVSAAALDRAQLAEPPDSLQRALAALRTAVADGLRGGVSRFKVVFDNAAVAIAISDTNGRIIDANPALALMVERSRDQLLGTSLFELLHGDDEVAVRASVRSLVAAGAAGTVHVEARYKCSGDAARWSMFALTYVAGAVEDESYLLAVGDDITERRDLQALLHHQARHDPLTALANRRLLIETLRAAIDSAQPDDHIGMCLIDLDDFKSINDRYGHGTGDQVLAAVATRLLDRASRHGEFVARIGGDEFVAVVSAPTDAGAVVAAGYAYLAAFTDPIRIGNHTLQISASAGVLVPSVAGADPETLLDTADAALYRAKSDGGGVLVLHPPLGWGADGD